MSLGLLILAAVAVLLVVAVLGSLGFFTKVEGVPPDTELHRLSFIDMGYCHLDGPGNLMTVCGVLAFKGKMSHQDVLNSICRTPDRFRERIVPTPADVMTIESASWFGNTRYWVKDPAEMTQYLTEIDLNEWAETEGQEALPADVMNEDTGIVSKNLRRFLGANWHVPVDKCHAPFHVYHCHDTEFDYIVWRVHHCMGDGQSLMATMMNITDGEPVDDNTPEATEGHRDEWISTAQKRQTKSRRTPWFLHIVKSPLYLLEALYYLLKLLVSKADPLCCFKTMDLSGHKRVASTMEFSLGDVKRIAQAHNATVNDVLVSCFTGALRRYMLETQPDRLYPAGDVATIRALTAVDFSSLKKNLLKEMGNSLALVYQDLPIHIGDGVERLRETTKIMGWIKGSVVYVPLYLTLFWLLGVVPLKIQIALVNWYCSKASVVLTNVVGPSTSRYCRRNEMHQWFFWPAIASTLGMGVGMASYNNRITINFQVDDVLIQEPEKLAKFSEIEMEELLAGIRSD